MKKTYKILISLFFLGVLNLIFTTNIFASSTFKVRYLTTKTEPTVENYEDITGPNNVHSNMLSLSSDTIEIKKEEYLILLVEVSGSSGTIKNSTISVEGEGILKKEYEDHVRGALKHMVGTKGLYVGDYYVFETGKTNSESIISINIKVTHWFSDDEDFQKKITVITKKTEEEKEIEKYEERNEDLESYYKEKKLEDLISGSGGMIASEQMLYLRSILYNDNTNGNHDLWNEFVSNTTAEQRQNLYRNMTYNLRDSKPEYQTVYNALNKQIQLDKGNATQEEVNNELNAGGQAQQNVYEENEKQMNILKTQLSKGTSENRVTTGEFHDVIDDIGYYKPDDETVSTVITDKASIVLTSITNIGMVFAILMLAILGIKYMLGSIEEKADYKKDLIPYLVGAGLLFGITTIVKILQIFGEKINNI